MALVAGMSLAVYTTVYPGVESYLADWYRSLCHQTDQDFELWIGLDTIEKDLVQKILGGDVAAHWVERTSAGTPAQIRQEALAQIVETCAGVVLVDSDDVLHPTRVAAARAGLEASELVACALCLIDQQGKDLGLTFSLPANVSPDQVLPRNNIFGFSNSAFRSDLLKRCLPISSAALLVDWFLATRAWLLGARLAFDRAPGMDYRQHATNTARLRFPILVDQVISDTALVRQHLNLVLAEPRREFLTDRLAVLTRLSAEIEKFHEEVVLHGRRLKDYVRALNRLRPAPLWWSSVANPALKHIWKSGDLEYENDKARRGGDRSGEAALCYRRGGF
jgi:hypothetical protein